LINSDNASYITFTVESDTAIYIQVWRNSGFEDMTWQLEEGETATAFAPYENICPISGYDSVSVDGCGKNLFDVNSEQTTTYGTGVVDGDDITVTGTYYCALDADIDAGNYVISGSITGTGNALISFQYDDNSIVVSTRTLPYAFTFTKHVKAILLYGGNGTSGTVKYSKIQIEKGSTATTYEPYQSTSANIQFGQTVYGGKSDFVMGGTEKTMVSVDLGDLSWVTQTSSGITRFQATLTGAKGSGSNNTPANAVCSCYKNASWSETATTISNGTIAVIGIGGIIAVQDSAYDDAATFTTAITGQKLVYELATPTTITTPIAPLKLLEGINNISSDGTTINLGYQQNNVVGELKGEIEQAFYNHAMIYNIQSESTAVNMEYTDDYKAVVCELPFVQEQHDSSTTPPTSWHIDLSACDIAVNGFACFYESGGMFIENYKVMPTIESVRKDDGCFKVGIGFYNVKMTSAADNIDNFIISMDITAFGKVLDLRTL
jgi:hypothetical protein